MPPPADISPDPARALTRTQQLAALLVMLGPEGSARILQQFESHEVESVSREMSRVSHITREQRETILHEFAAVARAARNPLSLGAVPSRPAAAEPITSLRPAEPCPPTLSASPTVGLRRITEVSAQELFTLLQAELPRTVALVISHLAPEKAAQVSALFRPDLRDKIIERLATLDSTPSEVVEKIVEVLNARLNAPQVRSRILRHEMA